MSDRLTPLDTTFLELEDADPSAHMHIGGALIFDPLPDTGRPPASEVVAEHVAERLLTLPRYRDRLSTLRVGRLQWPEWVRDERFDLGNHLRRAALPAPGGQAELEAWLSEFFAQRLDRAHPLWEAVILEGLADDRWAIATKTHHCLVDGVGAIDIASVLLDTEPDAPLHREAPTGSRHHRRREQPGLVGGLVKAGGQLARTGFSAVRDPRVALRAAEQAKAVVELLVRDEVVAAPRTSINVPIGISRRFATVSMPITDLEAVAHAHDGTLNDLVLALVAGGIHDLLVHRGEARPEQGVRAMVPVNIRPSDDELGLGNRISSLFVHLPVAIDDPLERLAATIEEAETLKASNQKTGSKTMIELAGYAPPALHTYIARSLFATRLFNVTVTNVPGPKTPLYACGARMRELMPLVPLAAEHALGVAAFSYAGTITLGVIADRDSMPDLEVFLDSLRHGLDELDLPRQAQSNHSVRSRSRRARGAGRTGRPPART